MAKNWNTRITETIAFIRNAVVPLNANRRACIADTMEHRYRKSTGIAIA